MSKSADHHEPSWRKPAGIFIILALIALWSWTVVTMVEWLGPIPWWLSIALYIIAGIVWIAPLKPLLQWMETGKFRSEGHHPTDG